MLPFRPKLGPQGVRCTLLSYAAPYRATLHSMQLYTLHPNKLCCVQLSSAAPYWSYAAPYLKYTLHPLS